MLSFFSRKTQKTNNAIVGALDRSQAIITFTPEGIITSANENFLSVVGYSLKEVLGQHHRLFVTKSEQQADNYKQFWDNLANGHFNQGEFQRIAKSGERIWLQATYTPILNDKGVVTQVVKFATNITSDKTKNLNYRGQIDAINKSHAVIEFDVDGTIITANSNFLNTVGYKLDEIQGKHHSLFIDDAYKKLEEYRQFWANLATGKYQAGQYKRIAKGGKEIWIEASYSPIFDANGKPFKVVKFATDITADKLKNANFEGQIAAIHKSQAVIEFDITGHIVDANKNFLQAVGYELSEIKGKHHRIFTEDNYANSLEYKQFWQDMSQGQYASGQYKRIGKGGREIWIEASYNPILDMSGKPVKVIKYATDITATKLKNADFEGQINALRRSQAVIEFRLDGTIIDANDNFLKTVGYKLHEVQNKHHSIFVDSKTKSDIRYKEFWASLRRGEYQAAQFKRITKDGRDIWIEASYNPIFDMNGKPFKIVKFATDITEKVKNQEKFNILSLVADGTDNSVIITDARGYIEYINPGFERLTGYKSDDVIGKKPGHLLQGQHTDRATVERIRKKLEQRKPFYEEIMNYTRSGEPYWIYLSINPIFNDDGSLQRFISVQVNITETKLATIDSGTRMAAIEQSNIVLEWDHKNTPVRANDVAIKALGVDSQQAALNLSSFDYDSLFSTEDQEKISKGEAITKELRFSLNADKVAVFSATVQPIHSAEGKLTRTVAYGVDMTARSNAIAELTDVLGQISRIASSISDVSSQTNLLSLNAKVESARAGEAGNGFGVVATEVKNLALRSAALTTEIGKIVAETNQTIQSLQAA